MDLLAHKKMASSGRGRLLGPVVAQSTRALLEQLVKENLTPSEGIWFAVINPDGWGVFSYRFDEFGDDGNHESVWEEYVAPILAHRWSQALGVAAKKLERQLVHHYSAFPRGRVVHNSLSGEIAHGPKAWSIYYGGNLPNEGMKKTINRLFSLPQVASWEYDEHERCNSDDAAAVKQALRLKQNWVVVQPDEELA